MKIVLHDKKPLWVKYAFAVAAFLLFISLPGFLKAQTITTTGSPIAVDTTYGAPSRSTHFSISGTSTNAGILVTPPAGFEVSIDSLNFYNTITVGANGTIPSTKVYIRLKATIAAGTYSGNIVLSSTGAATVNLPMPISTVTPFILPIDVRGDITYGTSLGNFTANATNFDFSKVNLSLKNSEIINSLYISFTGDTMSTTPVGTYYDVIHTSMAAGTNGFLLSNYTIIYNPGNLYIDPAPLIITANNVNKPYGNTLNAVLLANIGYSVSGLQNGETITNVSINYGNGAAANAAPGTYTGSVTASGAIGANGYLSTNYALTYVPGNLIVGPEGPSITDAGSLSSLTTVYGTPSTATSFTVSGQNTSAGILVTPPAGFEVSTDGVTFSNTVTVGSVGNIGPVQVYIRLKASTFVGSYTGNIVLSSAGATSVNVNMPLSTVTPAPMAVAAPGIGKRYGMVLTGSAGSTAFTVSGLQNAETVGTVTLAYGAGAAAIANVGTYNGSIIASAVVGGTFMASNYNITYLPGSIDVFPSGLIVVANNVTKPYGTSITASSGSVNFYAAGLQNSESVGTVTLTYGAGAPSSANAGTYNNSVVPSAATGGSFMASNYTITYTPNVLTVTPVALIITADDKTKVSGTANPALTASYQGFVNGDGPTQLTTQPVITTTAIQSSPVGQYLIAASGAASPNYTISYVAGTLTATAAELAITIPNTFTPNGDGVNDTWNIANLNTYPSSRLQVFNRYGTLLYTSIGYPTAWDGKYRGSKLPDGTYYYVISLGDGKKPLSGYIAIIR